MIFGTRPHGHRPRLCFFGAGLGSQSQAHIGAGPSPVNAGAGARLSSQDGVSQQQETVSLSLPQLNRLIEASFVWDESSASKAHVTVIPSEYRVTQKILNHWKTFRDLKIIPGG